VTTPPPRLTAALRLVVILDADAARGRDLATLAAAAVSGGATMLQVRGKQLDPAALAQTVRRVLAASAGVPVLVNDRLDVALATAAAGCHLGQDDLPLDAARAIVPAGFFLGGSAGDAEEAHRATAGGADYLGIGPVRTTANKPDAGKAIGAQGFARVRAATTLPCVAIGGVRPEDAAGLAAAGAAGLAVIGAVLDAPDTAAAARALRDAIDRALTPAR